MGYELKTEIVIDAPASRVWSILTDFDSYPTWNPFIVRVEGQLDLGAQLAIEIHPPGGRLMRFKPRVTDVASGKGFAWLGHLLIPGLFDGEHRFELVPLDDGKVKLVQSERFSGLLVPLLKKTLNTSTRTGFEAMNGAVKQRAESAQA